MPLCIMEKKDPAKFDEGSSVVAVGLCIGSPRLVGKRKSRISNKHENFCTTICHLIDISDS